MKIEVYYINGRIKTYDMSSFCNSEPFRHDNLAEANCYDKDTNNIVGCVSFDVRLDNLLSDNTDIEKGIFVYVNYYHISVDENITHTKKVSLKDVNGSWDYNMVHIKPGRCFPLVSETELPEISHIDVDGKICIKNINGKIINIQQIDEIYSTEVSDDNNTALYEKIYKIYKIRKLKNPNLDKMEMTKSTGIPEEILDKALNNQNVARQIKLEEDDNIKQETNIDLDMNQLNNSDIIET